MSDRLVEIEARLAGATPTPWRHYPRSVLDTCTVFRIEDGDAAKHPPVAQCQTPPDAALIAAAPKDLRDLLAVVKEIQRIVDEEADSHECTPKCSCVYASLRIALANLKGGT